MKLRHQVALFGIFAALCAPAYAVDWDAIKSSPAKIEVLGMEPAPLTEGRTDRKGWAKVPSQFTKYEAVVYMPTDDHNGVADIKVTADGYLFVACSYEYEGNQQGNWKPEVWDEAKFKTKGWHVLGKTELDDLIRGDNRKHVVFVKQVHKGDTLRLRCNKYRPPYPILVNAK